MVKNNPGEPYSRISSEEAFEMQQSGNSTVVDVRNQDEYEAGHVKGAIWIPVDEIVQSNGVRIMGEANILNKLPLSASNLYSKNIYNFINNLFDKDKKSFNINLEDEIIEKTIIK